jgi:hypothetical protein
MIFATLFPGDDGQFDYRVLLISLLLLFLGGSVLVWRLPVMLRTGQTQFFYHSSRVGTVRRIYERDKNPALYWTVCAFYFLGALLSLGGFVAIAFGLERVSH